MYVIHFESLWSWASLMCDVWKNLGSAAVGSFVGPENRNGTKALEPRTLPEAIDYSQLEILLQLQKRLDLPHHQHPTWWFPEMVVPRVIIHF